MRAPVNLIRLLQDYSDFIFRLYRADKLSSIFVLKLGELSHSIWKGFEEQPEQMQLAQTGAGVYLQCLQLITELDKAIREALPTVNISRLIYRSYDEASDDAIAELSRELQHLIPEAAIEIAPRNSPVDIIISSLSHGNALFLVTLFFATKTRLQISQLVRQLPGAPGAIGSDEKVFFSLAIGGAKEKTSSEALTLDQTIPGAIRVRFDVRYSTSLVKKIKEVVKTWAQ